MSITLRLVALTLLALAGAALRADACSCLTLAQPCEAAFQADVVFSGVVRGIEGIGAESGFPSAYRVSLEVIDGFRGVEGPTVTIVTPTDSAACGYHFVQGERYLVYADEAGGELRAGICSRTQPLAAAAADLAFLKTLAGPAPAGARVFGRVRHDATDLSGARLGAYDLPADLTIALTGPAGTREVRPDADGDYELTGLPTGSYEMTIRPPTGFAASPRSTGYRIELPDPRACAARDLAVIRDGRISGTVSSADGTIPAGVRILLAEASSRTDAGTYVRSRQQVLGPDGAFLLTGLPPGRYVVGVLSASQDSVPLPRPSWFHPGTAAWADARIIDLGPGERQVLPALRLPADLEPQVDPDR